MTGELPASPLAYALVLSREHTLEGHPEHPERFARLERAMASLPTGAARRIEPRPAPEQALLAVHPERYLRALEAACTQGPAYVDYAPTYVTPDSYTSACRAAGGTLNALDEVLSGRSRGGLALVRPPGHHATATRVSTGVYAAVDGTGLDEKWDGHTYKMFIAGRPVTLEAFGPIDTKHPVVGPMRAWNVVITTSEPGEITIRSEGTVYGQPFEDTTYSFTTP